MHHFQNTSTAFLKCLKILNLGVSLLACWNCITISQQTSFELLSMRVVLIISCCICMTGTRFDNNFIPFS